jgi:hypothetical protein
MKIDLQVQGLKELRESLTEFSDRRFNAAVATALTRTAAQVRRDVQDEAQRSLDRPTPYTLRQLRFTAASANNLSAVVGFNILAVQDIFGRPIRYDESRGGETRAQKYLPANITGGARRNKRFELALQQVGAMPKGYFAVPGQGAQIDAYGNMSRGQIKQILSQLGAAAIVAGSSQNTTVRTRVAAQKRAGGQFFAVLPGAKVKLQPGIYQRELLGKNITPVIVFVRATQYQARFDFYGAAQRSADAKLPVEVNRAVSESLARLKARSGA